MPEVITTAQIKNWRRQESFVKRINYTVESNLPWLFAMILTSVPRIMICRDFDKGTMVNHDLARIIASVPWLRTLGWKLNCFSFKRNYGR